MVKTNTLENLKYCRMVVLIKEDLGIVVETMDELMDEESATIWLKIRRQGHRNIILGAVYREQQLLRQGKDVDTKCEAKQNARWNKILSQWTKASRM